MTHGFPIKIIRMQIANGFWCGNGCRICLKIHCVNKTLDYGMFTQWNLILILKQNHRWFSAKISINSACNPSPILFNRNPVDRCTNCGKVSMWISNPRCWILIRWKNVHATYWGVSAQISSIKVGVWKSVSNPHASILKRIWRWFSSGSASKSVPCFCKQNVCTPTMGGIEKHNSQFLTGGGKTMVGSSPFLEDGNWFWGVDIWGVNDNVKEYIVAQVV